MRIDLGENELIDDAFSTRPMTFCGPVPKNFLLACFDLLAIETGDHRAREHWQKAQLQNLLAHAHQRSPFWKRRIGKSAEKVNLTDISILSRRDLNEQVITEGSLLSASDKIGVAKHSTSGSSGTPTEFFVSAMNAEYDHIRSAAQYFIDGRPLAKNKTILQHAPNNSKNGVVVENTGPWIAPLGSFFRIGRTKIIKYFKPAVASLIKEIANNRIGHLVSSPRIVEMLLTHVDADFFAKSGACFGLPQGESVDSNLRKSLHSAGVPTIESYSSEEVGLIASECPKSPGSFHIATSNVIVEVLSDEGIEVGGVKLGRVLVTHLHSYATPLIRYDLDDLACFADRCACGHKGPILYNIYGRTKSLVRHQDGSISPCYVRSNEILAIVSNNEYRIKQVDLQTLVAVLGGVNELSETQHQRLVDLIRRHAGDEFNVIINTVSNIDWGLNRKRLGFHNNIL